MKNLTFSKVSMSLIALALLAIFGLAGCGSGGGGNVGTINGIEVPPAPDTTANQATLSGVDVNSNGIRDDVERLNATEFGASPENYAEAINYAQTLQAAITSPTQETIAQHVTLVNCETDSQKLSDLKKITTATLDTPERRGAYGDAFAGAIISSEGCAQNLLAPSRSAASAQSINVVYINGIQNTLEDAGKTQTKIYDTLQSSINHTGDTKKGFIVTGVWNPVGWHGKKDDDWDLSQDKMELFLLKTAEEKYASHFEKILLPFNSPKTIDKDAAILISAYLEEKNLMPGDNSLETDKKITETDMQATKKAAISLVNRIRARGSAIVVAHSQGNLLANLAYAKLASEYGNDVSKMVRVVNVANTSEFSVNNLNFTHAGDAALFSSASLGLDFVSDQSLETMPSRGSNWTRTTPRTILYANQAYNFAIAPATFKAQNNIDGQDPRGLDVALDHSIYETYLSTAEVEVNDNTPSITLTPNAKKFIDRFEDFVYAAAESLSNAASGTSPSAPTALAATSGNGQVTISWDAVSSTTYNLYWSTSSGVSKTSYTGKISNVTNPYTHTGRTNGTTYYYIVTAVNSYGESLESSEVSAKPVGFGTLQGYVKDAVTKSAISNVAVSIYDNTGILKATVSSDSSGVYSTTLAVGTYSLSITKTGYITDSVSNLTIAENVITTVETVLQIGTQYSGTGNISGKITNALDGSAVSSATLNFRAGINVTTGTVVATTTTDSYGSYTVSGLNAGNYTGEAVKSGFTTAYFTATVIGGQTNTNQNATITPILSSGETRIVLTWGYTPSDLDSHLTGPITGSTSRFHVYFGNKGDSTYSPYATLDVDEMFSYGPETITIYQQFDGIYRYSVHDYSNSYSSSSTYLSNSSAQVKVYRGSNLVATFNVPPNQGGTLWTVFEMSGDIITPINTTSYVSSTSSVQSPSLSRTYSLTPHSDALLMRDLPAK